MALLFTGCPHDEPIDDPSGGGSEESGGEETGEPPMAVTLEEFFPAAEEAYCDWAVSCNQFGGVNRCKNVMHLETRLSMRRLSGVGSGDGVTLAYLQDAVDVGRIEFDADAAVACLDYVRARTCDLPEYHTWTEEELAGQAACEAVLRGRMGKNGPCAQAIECAEEAVCGFDPMCVDMCCPGACRVLAAPIAEGEPCPTNPNSQCEAGTGCLIDSDTFLPTVCTKLAEVGQSCEWIGCDAEGTCEYDGNNFSCLPLGDVGQACDYEGQCRAGLVCARDENFDNGECFAPAGEGEPCKSGVSQTCRRVDNVCDAASETCVTAPGNGEACPGYICRGDLFCAESLGLKCSPVADEGEPCDYMNGDYVPCSGDARCDYTDQGPFCVAPSADQCLAPPDPLGG